MICKMSPPIPLAANTVKRSVPGRAATVMEFLRGDAVAETLLPTATRYLDLLEDLRQLVPGGLLKEATICQFAAGILVIGVRSPSTASKMRQTLPRLIESLVGRGWKVNAIQLRVQPDTFQDKSSAWRSAKAPIGVPASALGCWQELASGLESSPLRDAVTALIAHQTENGARPK
jgi:hypothetical protein